MELLKQKFIEEFNIEILIDEVLDSIEENKLKKYIYNKFEENFIYGEIYNCFKNELSKEDLKILLEDMGNDFIDLDNLKEEKTKYF